MSRLTRRDLLAAAGCASLLPKQHLWSNHVSTAELEPEEDYRDCIAAIADYHIPELETIFIEISFRAVLRLARKLQEQSDSIVLPSGLASGENLQNLTKESALELKGYLDKVSRAQEEIRTLVSEKGAFEAKLISAGTKLQEEKRLIVEVAKVAAEGNRSLDWKDVDTRLKLILNRIDEVQAVVDREAPFSDTAKQQKSLAAARRFINQCIVLARASVSQNLIASLSPSATVKVPSVERCEKIVRKYVTPTVGRHLVVRAFSKPAFAVEGGAQATLSERTKMIQDALWCMQLPLVFKTAEIAAEVAVGE